MSSFFGNVAIVNNQDTVFTNAVDGDMVFYTETSNQSIHFGNVIGDRSTLKLTTSNVELRGDLLLTQQIDFRGLRIAPRVPTNSNVMNVTTVIDTLSGYNANATPNVIFIANSNQTGFEFDNSNGANIFVVTTSNALLTTGLNVTNGNITLSNGVLNQAGFGMFTSTLTSTQGNTTSNVTWSNSYAGGSNRVAIVNSSNILVMDPGVYRFDVSLNPDTTTTVPALYILTINRDVGTGLGTNPIRGYEACGTLNGSGVGNISFSSLVGHTDSNVLYRVALQNTSTSNLSWSTNTAFSYLNIHKVA